MGLTVTFTRRKRAKNFNFWLMDRIVFQLFGKFLREMMMEFNFDLFNQLT